MVPQWILWMNWIAGWANIGVALGGVFRGDFGMLVFFNFGVGIICLYMWSKYQDWFVKE